MRKSLVALMLVASLALPAAATSLWSSVTGDINFPGLTPTTIDNMTVGGTTPAPGTFSALHLDTGTKTATAVGTTTATATLSKMSGVVTSAALTTAAGGTWVLTLTNSDIAATDQVFASVGNGTSTTGTPMVATVTPAAGSVVVTVQNIHASAALNGTITLSFAVVKN